MARLPRLSIPGNLHHVMQRGNNREAIVRSDADRQTLLTLVTEQALQYREARGPVSVGLDVNYRENMPLISNFTTINGPLYGALAGTAGAATVGDAYVGFYLLAGQAAWVRWIALLAGVIAAVVVFGVSEPGRQLMAFGRDAWREVRKVVWPARKEAMQMTAYVFAFVVVMALFLWLTDKTLEWVFYDLILGWRK